MSDLYVRARVAERDVDIAFSVAAGEVLAVLGPNGAGKSTVLHVIAGLLRPDGGVVRLGQRILTDTAAGVSVPTHRRRVGLLLQDPLLFPHLSVAANVAFAPRSTRRGRRAAQAGARHWLQQLDAMELADRKPRQLSGGQAQRVAIARALAGEPAALLLDEPMAGLDVTAAAALRGVLRRVLAADGRCAVLVTHDILDVLTLADRVLVIEGGRVIEAGPAAAVLGAPRSVFGARLAGLNLVTGIAEPGGAVRSPEGRRWYGRPDPAVVPGGAAVAVFSPAAVSVFTEPPKGSPRNVVEVVVDELAALGSAIRLRAETQDPATPGIAADLTPDAAAELGLSPGSRVWFTVKAQEVALYPAGRGSAGAGDRC